MLQFISLSSGSSGNCYFLTDGDHGLLIDAGVSMRRLKRVLGENGFSMQAFQAVLVTHDHLDHIRHLGAYCKYLQVPVYTTQPILDALNVHSFTRDYIGPCGRALPPEGGFRLPLGDAEGPLVHHFVVPHDATQTVAYDLRWAGGHFLLMTDVGRMVPEGLALAAQADTVVIESNYDPDMLRRGGYPEDLKQRIRSGSGHLSNEECAAAVKTFWHPGLKNLFLCHLSANNNTPQLAYAATHAALQGIFPESGGSAADVTRLQILPRGAASRRFDL